MSLGSRDLSDVCRLSRVKSAKATHTAMKPNSSVGVIDSLKIVTPTSS